MGPVIWSNFGWPVANKTSTSQDRTTKKCFKNRCFVSIFFVGSSAAFFGAPYLIQLSSKMGPLIWPVRIFFPPINHRPASWKHIYFQRATAGSALRPRQRLPDLLKLGTHPKNAALSLKGLWWDLSWRCKCLLDIYIWWPIPQYTDNQWVKSICWAPRRFDVLPDVPAVNCPTSAPHK